MNFLNIGKANAEIERLKSDLSTKEAELKASIENAQELEKVSEKAVSDYEAKIAELEKKISAISDEKSKLSTELEAAKKAVTDFDAKVEQSASAKALQITSAQGQPPISSKPADNPASSAKAELKGLALVKASFEAQTAPKK